jgi:hypothetical protein
MRAVEHAGCLGHDSPEALTAYQLKHALDRDRGCRMTWAALIECVYEVNPLECPNLALDSDRGCHTEMKIIGFVEQEEESKIRAILSRAGLWREPKPRAPPAEPAPVPLEPRLDYEYFQTLIA